MFTVLRHWFQKTFASQGPPEGNIQHGKLYNRTGECHSCGQCCTNIYLVHGNLPIATLADYERIKGQNPEYEYFKPVAETEDGVRFQCTHLQEDNRCAIYEDRPSFCRRYPTEDVLLLGGILAENCGYRFTPGISFSSHLAQTAKKKRLSPEKIKPMLLRPGILDA